MKKITLAAALLAGTSVSLFAQIHGKDGYYNYTAAQIMSENKLSIWNGQKNIDGMNSNFVIDGDYIRVNMGLNNNNDPATGTPWRTDWSLAKSGLLKITKKYPVYAVKMSSVRNIQPTAAKKPMAIGTELAIHSPRKDYDNFGDGFGSNSRFNHVNTIWQTEEIDGVEVVTPVSNPVVRNSGAGNAYKRMGGWNVSELDPKADQVFFVNMYENLVDISQANGGIGVDGLLCYDSIGYCTPDIFNFLLADYTCDTLITVDGVTRKRVFGEETPYYNIKWFRTFESVEALEQFMLENPDGDDPSTPNQLALQTELYYAEKRMEDYALADESTLSAYKQAIEVATAIKETPAPNEDRESDAYKAWDKNVADALTALNDAKNDFISAVTLDLPYNYVTIKTLSEELGLGVSTTPEMVGELETYPLEFVPSDLAEKFTMIKNGTVNGQTAYSLGTLEGKVITLNGNLVLVKSAHLTSSHKVSQLVLTNRGDSENLACDMMTEGLYLAVNEENNLLKTIEELPEGGVEALAGYYLYNIQQAEYKPTAGEEDQICKGFEFDNGLEGWDINGWRRMSVVANEVIDSNTYMAAYVQQNYENAIDGSDPKVYEFDGSGNFGPGARREAGIYAEGDLALRNPVTYTDEKAIYTNSYYKRYVAIKWKGNTDKAAISSMTFLASAAEAVIFNMSEAVRQGDVYYWDMMSAGVPVGNKKWVAQYLGFTGYYDFTDKVYIDWIRFYDEPANIPSEEVAVSIEGTVAQKRANIYTSGRTICVNAKENSTVKVYSVDGTEISSQSGRVVNTEVKNAGVYIVNVVSDGVSATRKVMVK